MGEGAGARRSATRAALAARVANRGTWAMASRADARRSPAWAARSAASATRSRVVCRGFMAGAHQADGAPAVDRRLARLLVKGPGEVLAAGTRCLVVRSMVRCLA